MSIPDEPQDVQAGLVTEDPHDPGAACDAEAEEAHASLPAADGDAPPSPAAEGGDHESAETTPLEVDGADTAEPESSAEVAIEAASAGDQPDAVRGSDGDASAEADTATDGAEPEPEEVAAAPVVDRGLIEALLFAADEPLTPAQIKKVLGGAEISLVRTVLETIRAELDERKAGFALIEVAGGFQFRTRPEYGVWIRQLRSDKPPKLSKPALETLAVVSYKQPVTRAEIEAIRRVDTGAVLKTLLDRRLLKVVGTKDVPGRPALYGTSKEFLEVFRLKSLKELPTLKEIRDVAVEMGDALDLPRELLPEDVAAALPPVEAPLDAMTELAGESGEDAGEPDVGADQPGGDTPAITEEPGGSIDDEPAPSPPSAAAEED